MVVGTQRVGGGKRSAMQTTDQTRRQPSDKQGDMKPAKEKEIKSKDRERRLEL
jgi:hypothetical protein